MSHEHYHNAYSNRLQVDFILFSPWRQIQFVRKILSVCRESLEVWGLDSLAGLMGWSKGFSRLWVDFDMVSTHWNYLLGLCEMSYLCSLELEMLKIFRSRNLLPFTLLLKPQCTSLPDVMQEETADHLKNNLKLHVLIMLEHKLLESKALFN